MGRSTMLPLFLFALVLWAGCGPAPGEPFPGAGPGQEATRWLQGKTFIDQVLDGITVSLAFHEATAGSLVFRVEVANRGDHPVLVAPETMACRIEGGEDGSGRTLAAQDPEMHIKALAKAQGAEDASRSTNNAFRGLFLLMDLGDSIANAGQRTPEQSRRVMQDQRGTYADLDRSDLLSHQRSNALGERRRRWEEACLRRTTAEPGQGVRGLVEFRAL